MRRRDPRSWFTAYTRDLAPGEFQRLFTRDTPEAYRYFTRHLDVAHLEARPWFRRWPAQLRIVIHAFTMRLSPGRRLLYVLAVILALIGLLQLFRGFGITHYLFIFALPGPEWERGALKLAIAFVAINLLMLMEVADRLSLKGDLEIARDIQLAMLPSGVRDVGGTACFGITRPANTVGGDFYDVLPLPDGRVVLALGDVAGKGSPAALLMALLLAMMRTLVDEGLDLGRLMHRLNLQVQRQSPASRFITMFCAFYDPRDGCLEYVNAGHLPPLVRRATGVMERLAVNGTGGPALGMFEQARYVPDRATLAAGDTLVVYSDGITEAENTSGRPFDEGGLELVLTGMGDLDPESLGRAILIAVESHAGEARLADDLTALVVQRAPVSSADTRKTMAG